MIRNHYLNLGGCSSALIICAAPEAFNRTIVVWVPHPTDRTALTVLRISSTHGGDLGIHALKYSRENERKVIHLHFYKSGEEGNPNHKGWGAGRSGQFDLLHPPVNGWATHFDDRVKILTVLLYGNQPTRSEGQRDPLVPLALSGAGGG